MTISIFEYADINEASGDAIHPHHRRRTAQALTATYLAIGETALTRCVEVYNDSATTGVHVRVATASSGQDATQGDYYIGPDAVGTFLIQRKDRSATNLLYINAVADT